MQIAVLRETQDGESRVALVPESSKKLIASNATVAVESGAGAGAGARDADYAAAGARVTEDRAAPLASAAVLVSVNRPADEAIQQLPPGAVMIGFLRPLDEPAALEPIIARGLTAFALELVPRTTRAQAMDARASLTKLAQAVQQA